VNGYTAALYEAVARVAQADPQVGGDGLRWLRDVRRAGAGIPGVPVWYDDHDAGEIVRVRDGARWRIEDVPPLCVRAAIDLHAVDRWVEEQLELKESQVRARALRP
jgi:hypothetical protein